MSKEDKLGEAYHSRCYGLVSGVAYVKDFKDVAHAELVHKQDGPFYCQECLSEAIVRKCSDKEDHFAHKARLSPTAKKGDTKFHNGVRDELLEVLTHHFPNGNWQTEKQMKAIKSGENFIPDISGYFGNRSKDFPAVAVEVQRSPYSPRYIRKKTEAYREKGVNVIWIVPLKSELGTEEFRPRRYELYLHTMYLGYVFYYVPGNEGKLLPVHYGPAFRYIEPKTFFDSEANEVSAGDYYFKYKTLKSPVCGNPVFIYELATKHLNRWTNPNNGNLNVPERNILSTKQLKWWADDENKEWLKNNDWFRYVRRYMPYYNPDDENDELPFDDDENI